MTGRAMRREVGDIWAKAISRQHGHILRRVGAPHVVLPEHEAQGAKAAFTHASPETVLMYGDIVLVVGRIKDVERFAEAD